MWADGSPRWRSSPAQVLVADNRFVNSNVPLSNGSQLKLSLLRGCSLLKKNSAQTQLSAIAFSAQNMLSAKAFSAQTTLSAKSFSAQNVQPKLSVFK